VVYDVYSPNNKMLADADDNVFRYFEHRCQLQCRRQAKHLVYVVRRTSAFTTCARQPDIGAGGGSSWACPATAHGCAADSGWSTPHHPAPNVSCHSLRRGVTTAPYPPPHTRPSHVFTTAKMTLATVAYFTAGGLFTGLYSNAVRQLPLLRRKASDVILPPFTLVHPTYHLAHSLVPLASCRL